MLVLRGKTQVGQQSRTAEFKTAVKAVAVEGEHRGREPVHLYQQP